MLPAVWPGDLVTVQSRSFAELQPGQIVLYRREENLITHRIVGLSGDHLIARGDSLPGFDPPVREFEIVGQVVSIFRNGRYIDLEQSIWQRGVAWILRRSDFCTRILLLTRGRLRAIGTAPARVNSSPQPVRNS
jgi:hypothetical protein